MTTASNLTATSRPVECPPAPDGSRSQAPSRGSRERKQPETELPEAALAPLCRARCCVAALLVLAALRCVALHFYAAPTGLAWTAHMLSCAADGIATVGAVPALLKVTIGSCLQHRCLGSLLTLLLTATVCDVAAIGIFIVSSGVRGLIQLMGPIATDEGAPPAVAFIGIWECILVSSISLETALCVAAWQLYRAFREAGKYPPNAASNLPREVSALEFLCEAEDVALLSDQCNGCNRTPSRNTDIMPYSAMEDPKMEPELNIQAKALFNL